MSTYNFLNLEFFELDGLCNASKTRLLYICDIAKIITRIIIT